MSLKRPSPKKTSSQPGWQRWVGVPLRTLGRGVARLGKHFVSRVRRIRGRDRFLALLLLWVWIVLLLGNFYIRGVSRFEGSLITQTMSFTYMGEVDKQFLNSLGMTKLTLRGQQANPLSLRGTFTSPDPDLNRKLKSLRQLEVRLTNSNSSLTLESANPKQNDALNLQQLRILPNTQIEQLTYRAIAHQLNFCLQSGALQDNVCETRSAVAPNPPTIGELRFGVNPTAMDLFLASAQIPALGVTAATLETRLQWQPEGQDFSLPIASPTSVEIGLPKVNQASTEEAIEDLTQLIRGDITVNQVRFSKLDRSGNINDDILTSEILDGEVRMMGQSMKLQPRQFLIIPTDREFDKANCRMSPTQHPGIDRIRDIRLNLKDPKGLQTLISGESKCLAVGLYERFPTQSIEPSWLLKFLPQEGINAIYALISAFTGILFPRLFPDDDESAE